jgi:transposase
VDYQPRPRVHQKKARRDRLIRLAQAHPDGALGFEDEVWWSRVSQPAVRTWMDPAQPMRLQELGRPDGDTAPTALACYGLLVRWWPPPDAWQEQLWLRFVDGRPVSAITTPFLAWCCAKLAAAGTRALLLVWDNASWHVSKEVRAWIRAHTRPVKQTGQGVRIVNCYLPIKSPWLNPIEPKWVYGKRRIVEPDRVLTPAELAERVCAVFDCPYIEHLTLSKEAA